MRRTNLPGSSVVLFIGACAARAVHGVPPDMQNTVIESPGRTRPPFRPPTGLPLRRESRWGTVVSVLLHALVILLILAPIFGHDVALVATRDGLGPGARGGGGGGDRGSGGR